jgi:tetratricopeptide (TPR) repeat protein
LLSDALTVEPRYGAAASLAAITRLHRIAQGWSDDPSREIGDALRLVELALAVDPNDPDALCSAARSKSFSGQDYDGAFALVSRATDLCPNSASAWSHRGSTCVYIARPNDAISSHDRAIRLRALPERN